MADDDKTKIQKSPDEEPKQEDSDKEKGEKEPSTENTSSDSVKSKDDSSEAIGEGADATSENVDLDELIAEVDPEFQKELNAINDTDFSETDIKADNSVANAVIDQEKVPSAFRAFLSNLPKEIKAKYAIAGALVVIMVPLALFIFMGKLLPSFKLPYVVSMNELTEKVHKYPTDGMVVPLFDDFHSKSFTYPLPKTTITLKKNGEGNSYGDFEFFLNLRDEELAPQIKLRQSEIIDLIQRTLEEVTWIELQSPVGKEKVKKVIRHRLNEHLQGNLILGVFYRSVVLQK